MKTIAVLGTFDTKGVEHAFVAEQIKAEGYEALLIDVGVLGPPTVPVHIDRYKVAAAVNGDLQSLAGRKNRGEAVSFMSGAAPALLAALGKSGRIHGVISLGGTGGTAIATAAMRALPLGFPKIMVSTVASGNTSPYVGVKDVVMFPSIVDIAGLNRVSRLILRNAAGAICGMVGANCSDDTSTDTGKPLIVASMFGNTTKCVERARSILEDAGYEVLVFHATGVGGRTMESLVEAGLVAGVLDITTTEWADQLVGGVLSAGPNRLEAAARGGVPAIIVPGCLDMVNFGPPESVPQHFNGRLFYQHNPQVTLMRTTPQECAELGRILAEKINLSTGPVTVLIPMRGFSVISEAGGAFHDATADAALVSALKTKLRSDISVVEIDSAINGTDFAEICASRLLENISRKSNTRK